MTKDESVEVYGRCAQCCRDLSGSGFTDGNDTVTWCESCLDARCALAREGYETRVGQPIPWMEW
jgi:hypothetical protein